MSLDEDIASPNPQTEESKAILPEKSKSVYQRAHGNFTNWCTQKNVETITENVLLAYFSEKSKNYKGSSLWTFYSMLKSTIFVERGLNIGKFGNLISFLKSKAGSEKPKKSKVLKKEEVTRFIKSAPDDTFLMAKVALILGIYGGCSREELTNLQVDNIQDCESVLIVTLQKSCRTFTVVNNEQNFLKYYRKYAGLRPKDVQHRRFFLNYRNGKCSSQPVGKNTFGSMPTKMAEFLGLPEPSLYTGHCFRRTSSILLGDSHSRQPIAWRYSSKSKQPKEATHQKIILEPSSFQSSTSSSSKSLVVENENSIEISSLQNDNLDYSTLNYSNVPSVTLNNCSNCKISIHIHIQDN
ncbi:unnamed protein product [Ceutorhynchus assimilis]|uniref:Tyr recombinase domain-containing protein n=1 Tax=Ceutorhynchus assimilis TaxID=467358 RepID=A0A9N9QJD2_9CUCU|nr:unnamed protein product [Ceutorhynchus assimilis]